MKWFNEKEFACRCCGQLPPFARENTEALVSQVLDPLRERCGHPIYVSSGYRCPTHNREVGGVAQSQHLKGEASDIRPVKSEKLKVKSEELKVKNELNAMAAILVEQGRFDQLILYSTFLHVSYKRSGRNRGQILRKISGGYRPMTRKEVLGYGD